MMDDDTPSPACCPDVDREQGRFMSGDCHVVDLHRHKGMLRGLVLDGGARPRPLTWLRNGQLSPQTKGPFDLERIG
jgi:hypothetical protein